MNLSIRPSARLAGSILSLLGLVLAVSLLAVFLLAIGVRGYVRLGRDTGALRDSLMQSTAAAWDKQIEINVGSFTLSLVRFGLSFVDLDPEGRLALEAFRGAEVGVYQLQKGQGPLDYAPLLSAADKAMAGRGWDRVVGVLQARELVAVYVPRKMNSHQDVHVCVLALNGSNLVVVSARSNLEPLLQLALRQCSWNEGKRMLSRL